MVSMSHLSSFTSAMLYYDNICPAEPWQQTLGIYNLVDKWKIASQTHHSRHIGRVWYYLITEVDAQDGSIQEASPAPSKALLIFLFFVRVKCVLLHWLSLHWNSRALVPTHRVRYFIFHFPPLPPSHLSSSEVPHRRKTLSALARKCRLVNIWPQLHVGVS